ncbi:VOC family protein [Roseomonas oryzicola]|uniref:VOC family protein n=2 Tax=Neoroseomonas oryzicola TaxID=535904 RepID=A0A9X9WJW9_9PROT|nr:VOC family protein [Neoroseomonas oryzicola]NKE20012.1 VOC family protein [Neoroseomonas oryzicola]
MPPYLRDLRHYDDMCDRSPWVVPLGYQKEEGSLGVAFTLPEETGRSSGPGAVYVRKPYDGEEATVGNGSMMAFQANAHEMVRNLHAAGLEAGGPDEGAPGFRAEYSDRFYVAYLRDPLGNKVAIYCVNPAERRRGD